MRPYSPAAYMMMSAASLPRRETWYDNAQVCLTGHMINEASVAQPVRNADFCEKCGKETITACPHCEENIRGYLHRPGAIRIPAMKPPAYCHYCGSSFPWTEDALNAARDLLADVEGVSDGDKAKLALALPDLVSESPKSVVAASKWKRFLNGPGSRIGTAVQTVLINVVTEAVKKGIWGP